MSESTETVAPYEPYLSRPLGAVVRDVERFAGMVVAWNKTHNLVSRETVAALWPRHIGDSLQVLPQFRATDLHILDIGSGGGFPALPLAIACKARRSFTLVEPIAKKAAFLRAAGRELGLGLRVETERIEHLYSVLPRPDVITSRAVASLDTLFRLTAPLFGVTTRAIFHKGREHVDELAESRVRWQYDVVLTPSRSNDSGMLLTITNLVAKSSR